MRDDTTPPATAASAYDPYDADRPLMLRCSCGADHAPTEHGAAAPLPDTETLLAGLAWLLVRDRTVPVVLEEDLGDCYIEECAWAEVQGVAELLSASVEARRDLALAVAANAPDEKLPDFGLTGLRDPLQLMIDLGIPPRARDPQPGPSVFERARRRHALRRT